MTLGIRERDAQHLTDLRTLPGLIGWYDFARNPLGAGVAAPAEGTAVDRAYDVAGKLASTVQTNAAARPVYIPSDPGGRVVNAVLNPSANPTPPMTSAIMSPVGSLGTTVAYDATVGHLLGRSIKITQAATTAATASWGRKWGCSSGAFPAGACVVYGGWWVRNNSPVNLVYIPYSDGVTGAGGPSGLGATNTTAGSPYTLTPGTWTFVERWWNLNAADGAARVNGFGAYVPTIANDGTTQYSFHFTEAVVVPVSAVGVRPTAPQVQCDPSTWPGRYAWQGTPYASPTVTIPSVGGLYFDGVDDILVVTPSSPSDVTTYCAWTGLDGGGPYGNAWVWGAPGSAAGSMGAQRANGTARLGWRIDAKAGGNDTAASFGDAIWEGRPHLSVGRVSLASLVKSTYFDGSANAAQSAINTTVGTGNPATQFSNSLFRFASGAAGVMHGWAAFDRMHDRATRRPVEALFSRRYGTPLSAAVPA